MFCTTGSHASFQVGFRVSRLSQTLTLFLLPHAIKLVGWLKHCNLSLGQLVMVGPTTLLSERPFKMNE